MKSADVYVHLKSKRILLESCQAIAGCIQLESFTSPSVFFLESDSSEYLELECTFTTDDVDEIPDFLGRAMGYRFGMPEKDGSLGLLKCPETTLRVSWISQSVQYEEEDPHESSDSDVSDLVEEVL
jgi:hypothetical protein